MRGQISLQMASVPYLNIYSGPLERVESELGCLVFCSKVLMTLCTGLLTKYLARRAGKLRAF